MEAARIPFMKEAARLKIYQDKGALWIPTAPQGEAVVHLGRLPKATFNSETLTAEEMRMAACDLVSKAVEAGAAILTVTRVVGAMPFADYVATEIRECSKIGCRALAFDEVARVREGETVLVVEDSFTTGCRAGLVQGIVEAAGAKLLPHILTQVNLLGDEYVSGRKITNLINIAPEK